MAIVPQSGFAFRQYRWPKFTGGLTFTQAQPSDCVQFMNIEMERDQYVRPRKGIKRLHAAGALGSGQVVGMGIVAAGKTPNDMLRSLLVVAKRGTTFYYTDLRQPSPLTFSSFTVPLDPSDPTYVFMDTATNDAGEGIVVMASTTWPSLAMWDGVSAAATYIADSPASLTLCSHTDGRVYAVPETDLLSLRGFGTTIGNSLRRVLLSSIEGCAITAVRIEGVSHEFTTLPGVREDVTDIILNLKSLICRLHGESPEIGVHISKKGPGAVTAADIEAPADLEILNPELEIAHLSDKGKLEMMLTIGRGRGYVPAELNRGPETTIGVIPIEIGRAHV